jgi:hypothetical protein
VLRNLDAQATEISARETIRPGAHPGCVVVWAEVTSIAVHEALQQLREAPDAVVGDGDSPCGLLVGIYNPEPDVGMGALTPSQETILHCLHSRHADGYIRQRHVARLLHSHEPWLIPYVVALVATTSSRWSKTYETSLDQLDQVGSEQQRAYGSFVAATDHS